MPYTPDTSPAIASQTGVPRTRNSTRLCRTSELGSAHSKGYRVEKSAPRKKRERTKATKRSSKVLNPLSEFEKDYPSIPIADIETYVHRPMEARLQEVAESKTPGKVKRPMNAFMLYRKAYQNLAKALCTQNNHQVVSQVCGDTWPLEPEVIRAKFNEWARIERENHHHAHPNYKFTPSKPARKPKRTDNESDDGSVLADPDWTLGRAAQVSDNRAGKQRGQPAGTGGASLSIFESYHAYGSPNMGMSPPPMYRYPNGGKHMSSPYNNIGLVGGQYCQQTIHSASGRGGLVEDIIIREIPSSATYGRVEQVQNAYHERPSQYPPIGQHLGHETAIDPSLVSRSDAIRNDGFYDGFGFGGGVQWQGQQEMPDPGPPGLQESMAPLDDVLAQDPQLGYLRGDEESWKVEEIGGHHSQMDGWPA